MEWTAAKQRGPIPKDVAVIKENGPYAPGKVPALFFPARYEKRVAASTTGSLDKSWRSSGAHTERNRKVPSGVDDYLGIHVKSESRGKQAEVQRGQDGLLQVPQEELSRLRLVMTSGTAHASLPELDEHGRDMLATHLGLPRGVLNRSPAPDVDTFERARRCAIHVTHSEPVQTSAPKEKDDDDRDHPRRAEAVANIKTRVIETRGLGHAKDTYRMPNRLAPSNRSDVRRKAGSQTHRPMLESHSFNHVSNTEDIRQRMNVGRLQDSVNLLLVRVKMQRDKQRPQREGRYTYLWDALQKDDEYLMKTAISQDFKGRRALNQPPDERARYKASQIQYLWRRAAQQQEVKEARDEEDRLLREKRVARAAARKKREEEEARVREEERKRTIFRLGNTVLRALCTDPLTKKPTDPRTVFRRLDADKSGTVDKEELRQGLEYCECFLPPEEFDLIWDFMDEADGGERDGEVDYAVLVARLEAVNQVALRRLRPPEAEHLRRQSAQALHTVQRQVQQAERRHRHGGDQGGGTPPPAPAPPPLPDHSPRALPDPSRRRAACGPGSPLGSAGG